MTEKEIIEWLSSKWGYNLVNDDGGRWAVSDGGLQPVPEEGGFKDFVSIVCFVEPEFWKPTIREAVEYYIEWEKSFEGDEEGEH